MGTKDSTKVQDKETPTISEFTSTARNTSLCAGILFAISLVIVDAVILALGGKTTSLFDLIVQTNIIMSGLFIVSLVGGVLVGRAYLRNSALTVIIYGGAWFLSVFLAFIIAAPFGFWEAIEASVSLFLGGFSLLLYRILQGEKGIDDLLILVMTASTALNLLYFILVLGVMP